MKELNFRDLTKDDVEVRVARCGETKKGKYVELLIYKDARVDQTILDETVGPMNWQREHNRDNANCVVSIWDSDKNLWVSKEDTGSESNTEKEKGLASDSFKRACFNWGIGRELYTAPKIFIYESDSCVIAKSGDKLKCNSYFDVSNLKIVNKKITELQIINSMTGVVVFDTNGKVTTTKTTTTKAATSKTEVQATAKQEVKAETKVVKQETTKATELISLENALKTKIGKLTIGQMMDACKDKEKANGCFLFLKQQVKDKTENAEPCLVVVQAINKKELSFKNVKA